MSWPSPIRQDRRIGAGTSTLRDGVVSHANALAQALGAALGLRLFDVLRNWLIRSESRPVT